MSSEILRSMPRRVKADRRWLTISFNGSDPCLSWSSAGFPPASWWTFDCSLEGSSMIHLRTGSGYMTKLLELRRLSRTISDTGVQPVCIGLRISLLDIMLAGCSELTTRILRWHAWYQSLHLKLWSLSMFLLHTGCMLSKNGS